MKIPTVGAIVIAVGVMGLEQVKAGDDVAAGWDKQAAAGYLDGRENAWFAWDRANRGQGTTKTSCVCCHTLVPYAMARPVLRRLSGEGQAVAAEIRLLDQTKRRVSNWDSLDTPAWRLLYDFSEEKKQEALGTEAVLNVVMLAFDDRYQGRQNPSDELKKALGILWSWQTGAGEQKGSWDWLDFNLEPWESERARYYGAALAAVAVGTAPGYLGSSPDASQQAGVNSLRNYLLSRYDTQELYNRIWMLWASRTLGGLLSDEQTNQIVAKCYEKQNDDGGWNLSSLGAYQRHDGTQQVSDSDGYATGLILHVLQTAGQAANHPKITKGLDWLRTHQRPTGAWPGFSLNKNRNPDTFTGKFMSDAATAFAVLALGHQD